MSESRAAAQTKVNQEVLNSLTVTGNEATASTIKLVSDEGDDAGDKWNISVADGGSSDAGALTINTEVSGSSANVLNLTSYKGSFGNTGSENNFPISIRPFVSQNVLRNFGLGPLHTTTNVAATADRLTPIGVFRNIFDLISSNLNATTGALADVSTADTGLLPGLASVAPGTFVSATTHWLKNKIFVTNNTAVTTNSATGTNGTSLNQNDEFGFVFGKDLTLTATKTITLTLDGTDKILHTGTELVSYNAGRTALVTAAEFSAADGAGLVITAGATDAVIKAGSFILGRMNGGAAAHLCLKGFINTSSGTVTVSKS